LNSILFFAAHTSALNPQKKSSKEILQICFQLFFLFLHRGHFSAFKVFLLIGSLSHFTLRNQKLIAVVLKGKDKLALFFFFFFLCL
jgi:hypothetical protein